MRCTTITVTRHNDGDVEIVINGTPTQMPVKDGAADAIGVIAPAVAAALEGIRLKAWSPPKVLKKS